MKKTLEILVYKDEYRVIYNGEKAKLIMTFPKSYQGRLDLLAFIMGYLGINLEIGKRFKEIYKGEKKGGKNGK